MRDGYAKRTAKACGRRLPSEFHLKPCDQKFANGDTPFIKATPVSSVDVTPTKKPARRKLGTAAAAFITNTSPSTSEK